jgi:5-(carboxyamino)imidazole ribonucleotide synthase
MMTERAARLHLTTHVLDPSPDCPASTFAATQIVADFDDARALEALAERSDVVTFDIERGNLPALQELMDRGTPVRPGPRVLTLIRDKLLQRRFLEASGLPMPRYAEVEGPLEDAAARFGYPFVQKARRDGYDGRGVAVLQGPEDLQRALSGPSMIEERIDIARELAVIVVRGADGEMRCYPTIETLVDPRRAVLDGLLFPAPISPEQEREAWSIAATAVCALDGVGSFTVEMFLDRSNRLTLNEVSPRPHNAGHVTIEAAETCQFEQHLRAVTGLPLGDTRLVRPAAMVNLLAQGSKQRGPVRVEGLDRALALSGVRLHLYGKTEAWAGRKMGHLTVLDDDPSRALDRAMRARDCLRIEAATEVAA